MNSAAAGRSAATYMAYGLPELASVQSQVKSFSDLLGHRLQRIHDALAQLRAETLLRFKLCRPDEAELRRWLAAEEFRVDEDGYFESRSWRAAWQQGVREPTWVVNLWSVGSRDDLELARRLYALQDVGSSLLELHRRLDGVAWVYYQDVRNSAVAFPAFDQKTWPLPPDFDWREYHTFRSVEPSANPERRVRWTPPTIDYGPEGLITSASVPVYEGDSFVGLWSIDVPLRSLHLEEIHQTLAPEQQNFIVDVEGYFVAHASIETEIDRSQGAVLRKHLSALGGDFAVPGKVPLDAIVREGSRDVRQLELHDGAGRALYVMFHVIPELGWVYFATFPRDRLMAATREKLAHALDRIRKGDLLYRLEATHDDGMPGMEQLAEAYNAMSETLARNLAARERVEQHLKEARAVAEAANAAKGHFLALVSHELRTPLTPVLLLVEALDRDPALPDALRGRLATIRRNVKLEVRLIDDLLDFVAYGRGDLRIEPTLVDLHEVLEHTRENCAAQLAAGGVHFSFDLAATRHQIRADAARLLQVFWNLLRNALKHTPPGERIVIRTRDVQGGVRVEVADTGNGIPSDYLTRIFEPWVQLPTSHVTGGLGLGLAIAKVLVEGHGGTVSATSPGPGKGSTFIVDLPA